MQNVSCEAKFRCRVGVGRYKYTVCTVEENHYAYESPHKDSETSGVCVVTLRML